MRKIIVYCDRCGQQTEKVYHLTVTQERIEEYDEVAAPGMGTMKEIDLCWNCLTDIQQFAITAPAPTVTVPIVEVDKSAAVATPSADTEDRADTRGAKGKLSDIDPDYLRQLADEGLTPARIRDRIEQDFGIKVGISSVQYRLHKMGL